MSLHCRLLTTNKKKSRLNRDFRFVDPEGHDPTTFGL